jgi:hypothetical protein
MYGRQVGGLTAASGTGALAFTGGTTGLAAIVGIALVITGLIVLRIVRVRSRTP